MTTDNKTLADAQPGGRVRLGDQPWPEIDAILADAYSAGATGLPFEGIARRHAVRAAVAPLSDQPSPGGQDALAVIEELAELNRACAALDPDYKGPSDAAVQAAIAALAALAARQPVEVSEGEFRAAASRQTASAESNATAEAMIAIARQPVGEPVAWLIERLRGKGYGRDKYLAMKGQASSDPDSHLFWTDQQARDNHRVTPLYEWPAQAVDLGQFRAQIADLLRSEFDLEIADPEDHRHDDGSGEADRIAGKIVVLLDSQAVGK
ncbi:hypothetical protein [uncultured Stenotrophomonas sp.]|uniref:hypothetical protein n=1 Tax=uncultured Stenotrophomonas sp. TaxID=165438 RepID=UPI00206FC625|nr:hypothetical protein [uncultured Stenotrophomonas sp.]DAI92570.1 MAG TPA: hypothetical protein [Caudoviricetes sp.]